ncbi:MAG: sulfurtransferase complex subunit TusB [Alphaproteobacteria bacterium]|nr:sulfurtransferase complex subunit TusB [Alphaproteobacteria bacterium]
MLHTVNKSPFERPSFKTCLRYARTGDSVLLYEDGVYAARNGSPDADALKTAIKDRTFYVLGPDMEARGIAADQLIAGITIIDYGGFVDLAAGDGPVQAWL